MHTPQFRERNKNNDFGAFVVGLNKALTFFLPFFEYSTVPLKYSTKLSHLLHTYEFLQKSTSTTLLL